MKALIVVDVQNDFVPGGALAVPDGDAVVPVVQAMIERFDLVVATQDWHPEDHGSFALNHPAREPGQSIKLDGLDQILWPIHCVQETRGAEFVAPFDFDHVFRKGTDPRVDSYSGFFDNQRRHSTGLGAFLRERGVTDVYVLGLATDYCVLFTALDAVDEGFETWLIEDGCRGVELNQGDVARAVERMREAGVHVIRSDDLVEPEVLGEGRYLRLVRRGRWEYVQRINVSGIVAMVAVTDEGELVLVEQERPAVGRVVIDVPAGLAGDVDGEDSLLDAARRELEEETGFVADRLDPVGEAPPSPGLSSEIVTFFRASGLRRVSEGGGVDHEKIRVHLVPVHAIDEWLEARRAEGALIDLKLYAGLHFIAD